jgi:hypothetical protein
VLYPLPVVRCPLSVSRSAFCVLRCRDTCVRGHMAIWILLAFLRSCVPAFRAFGIHVFPLSRSHAFTYSRYPVALCARTAKPGNVNHHINRKTIVFLFSVGSDFQISFTDTAKSLQGRVCYQDPEFNAPHISVNPQIFAESLTIQLIFNTI